MCIAFAIMFIGLSILDIEYALLIALGIAFLVRIAILRQRSCFVAVVAYFVFERQY